jgi:hypothetical protein
MLHAWHMGVQVVLLQPVIGRELRKRQEWIEAQPWLYELEAKGIRIRSDRSHSNYNGAQVTGVEKREVKTPMEIQKQAVDLDEKMSGVAAPAVGPWQRRQLNELGGVNGEAAGLRPVRGTRARI